MSNPSIASEVVYKGWLGERARLSIMLLGRVLLDMILFGYSSSFNFVPFWPATNIRKY